MPIDYDERLRIHSAVESKLRTFLAGTSFEACQLKWMDCERKFTYFVQVPQEAALKDFSKVLHSRSFNLCGKKYKVSVPEDDWVGVHQLDDGTYEYLKHFVATIV
ncbi:hypothetical protein FOCC_FOCC008299 [Frankliniella occidentalis]|uniref:Uncharacterized protein LOC113214842 n=1 Tax=Frankliniella occidentalis TaxID=133901 RepID=A0A6J1TA00_FRAOC|nr:uncharacterized protein LOC113214842 [Frankliniella occidentalis]KAE8745049.1 hypothetical protein FOCC_FOCC008299 [Frankliniella occidentalis]